MDAIYQVLNKVFAGIFLECSHRFRKGRGTQTFFAQSSITINGCSAISYGHRHPRSFYSRGALGPVNIAYSGVYQWWYTIGLRTNEDLYTGALFLLFISAISLIAGWLHLQPKWKPSVSWFKNAESRLNHHLSGLFGVSSLAWTGHLVHVAIPASRGEYVRWNNFLDVLPHTPRVRPTFYRPCSSFFRGYYFFGSSTHVSLPPYAFIAQDFTTQAALYTHHQYIAGFIMTGAFAHGAIFFIRDYNPEQNEDNVLARMLEHKEAIISHLSWASLFLGFHTLGLYVHNDVMLAFGPGDFLVHHAIALGLHTTTLILVKGALDARGSKLMPDKRISVIVFRAMAQDEA
ncbi:hypothetical protein OSB04_un001837, partial [Centaurea solstitialis]